jgi:hypothetical protein
LCRDTGGGYNLPFYQYAVGSYVHVALTMSASGNIKLFINGVGGMNTWYGSSNNCNQNFARVSRPYCRIGSTSYQNSNYWGGKITGVKYFESQLSDSEIALISSDPPLSLTNVNPIQIIGLPSIASNGINSGAIIINTTTLGSSEFTIIPYLAAGSGLVSTGSSGILYHSTNAQPVTIQTFSVTFGAPASIDGTHTKPYW